MPENALESRPEGGGSARLPTNLRLLRLLEVLAASAAPPTVPELVRALALPKATVHRLCQTAIEEGFVRRDPADPRRLRPARRARALGAGLLAVEHRHIARHQLLRQLSAEIGETVNLVVAEAEGMRYIDRVETDWPLRFQLPIGSHVPFHCTASGKTFLASLAGAERRHLLETVVEQDARAALAAELDRSAARGYAVDDGEFIDGMVAVAAPVLNARGGFFAALATHAPAVRTELAALERWVPALVQTAARVTQLYFAVQEPGPGDERACTTRGPVSGCGAADSAAQDTE